MKSTTWTNNEETPVSLETKLKMYENSKTQIARKLNSNCDNSKKQIVTKPKYSNCDKTQKLKLLQNSKTQIVTNI